MNDKSLKIYTQRSIKLGLASGTVIPAKVHRHPRICKDLMTLALDSKDSCLRRNDGSTAGMTGPET